MTLEEYGIDYKKIPHNFWLTYVKYLDNQDYINWCQSYEKDTEDVKCAFQYLWEMWISPYYELCYTINCCLNTETEVPEFIQKLRNAE